LPLPSGVAAGWLGAGGAIAAEGVVEASSRVVGVGVGFGAGFGPGPDRPAVEEWRLDAGVLPLRVEPDRPADKTLADRIASVLSSRPPRTERDGADATTCTER
jgi:hypothetical protein